MKLTVSNDELKGIVIDGPTLFNGFQMYRGYQVWYDAMMGDIFIQYATHQYAYPNHYLHTDEEFAAFVNGEITRMENGDYK